MALNCAGMESSWLGWLASTERQNESNRMQDESELCTHAFHFTVLQVSGHLICCVVLYVIRCVI